MLKVSKVQQRRKAQAAKAAAQRKYEVSVKWQLQQKMAAAWSGIGNLMAAAASAPGITGGAAGGGGVAAAMISGGDFIGNENSIGSEIENHEEEEGKKKPEA